VDFAALSIQQLRYLDAVARGSTFADAADELFVSQSALSQGLARLEEIVETSLFESDGRRRRLTEAGRVLADSASRVLGEMDSVAADLEARAAGAVGTLRVGMIDAAALYLFSDGIASFRLRRPDVEVLITVKGSDDCLGRLARFDDDVAIVVGPALGFETELVAEEPFCMYGPEQSPSPGSTWVLYPTYSHTRAMIDRALQGSGFTTYVIAESGNPEVLRQLAVLNGSWTVLPGSVSEQEGLIRGEQIACREIVVARRQSSSDNLLVDTFVDGLSGNSQPGSSSPQSK
jgi:DNA-binding transcriptional LysR family regulator